MKRSAHVALVISGAILTGCSRSPRDWDSDPVETSEVLTNNTYVHGHGYYHAPYHAFFPYPYNYYFPGRGYYYGGNYGLQPDRSALSASSPSSRITHSGVDRGGFARSSSSHVSSAS
jgi:hypothetical protein